MSERYTLEDANREIKRLENIIRELRAGRGELEAKLVEAEQCIHDNNTDLTDNAQHIDELKARLASQSATIKRVGAKMERIKFLPTFRSRECPEEVFLKLDYVLAALGASESGGRR